MLQVGATGINQPTNQSTNQILIAIRISAVKIPFSNKFLGIAFKCREENDGHFSKTLIYQLYD
jgi:hypothetical protein